jgi:putative transposase
LRRVTPCPNRIRFCPRPHLCLPRTTYWRGGDFEPVFRALVGETAALSPSSILKLKADWQQEYEAWKQRPLRGRYVYLYADGLYLKAGAEQDKTALLVVLGVDEQGHKELLAMEQGYRESTASWSEVLRSLNERGLTEAPLLAIGDGALGLWAALDEVFPTTRHQRCWNHRTRKESTCRCVAA